MRAGSATGAPPVLRLLGHPRVACLALGLILAAAAWPIARRPALDMDAWWIAAAGRATREMAHVPRTNFFSFTEPDRPWIMHEWLFGVIFDRGITRFGPAFLSWFGFLSASATGTVLVGTTLGRARHAPVAALLCGLVLLGVIDKLDSPRPLYASALFATVIAALAFGERFERTALTASVLVECIWANAHGSFPLGVALLFAGSLSSPADRVRRARAGALAGAATLANPYGSRLYLLVFHYGLGGNEASTVIRAHLGGFMPLWRFPPAFVDARTLIAVAAAGAACTVCLMRQASRPRGLVGLALLLMGTIHVRHLVLGVLVSSVIAAPAVDAYLAGPGLPIPAPVRLWRAATALVPALAAGCVGLASKSLSVSADDWIPESLGGPDYVRVAAALSPDARVHTRFHTSGLFLWLAAPRGDRVLYDSRNDPYSAELITAGFALDEATAPGEVLLGMVERYGADHAIMDSGHPLTGALLASTRWQTRRREGRWILFARVDR